MHLFKLLPLAAVLVLGSTGVTDLARKDKRAALEAMYASQLGVREQSGNNDGRQVEEYLRFTGLGKGSPWCAAFVCWCMGRVGIANPRSAWCPDLFPTAKVVYRRSRATRQAATEKAFRPGNVFGLWFAEKGRIAHAGFIDGVQGTWAITVEGNTNAAGSREGDGVYRKRRLISSVYQVADWID